MMKAGILSVLAAAFLSMLIFNCSPSLNSDRTAPRVENGVLDLRHWDLKNDGPVALDGKWEFYWNSHLEPIDFSDETPPTVNAFIEVPGTWNGRVIDGQKINGDGYATYRLKIHLADSRQTLAFKFLDMATSFSVYLDGEKLLSTGIPGKTLESTTPRFLPQVVEFTPGSKQLQVVIQISNFHHRKGGAWESILFGISEDIWQISQSALNLDIFLFGGILMIGLYHISLFIIRAKEKSTLFFGIFCFLIAIRSLVTGERYLVGLWPDFSWEVYTKIAYLTFYIAAPVFAMYFRYIFPQDLSKYFIYLMIIVSAVFSTIVLLTPARIYSNTIPLFQIFTVVSLLLWVLPADPGLYPQTPGSIYLPGRLCSFVSDDCQRHPVFKPSHSDRLHAPGRIFYLLIFSGHSALRSFFKSI